VWLVAPSDAGAIHNLSSRIKASLAGAKIVVSASTSNGPSRLSLRPLPASLALPLRQVSAPWWWLIPDRCLLPLFDGAGLLLALLVEAVVLVGLGYRGLGSLGAGLK